MKRIVLFFLMTLAAFSLFAEGTKENFEAKDTTTESGVKYVFMFIGDGMSSPEINAAQVYNGSNTPLLIAIEPLIVPASHFPKNSKIFSPIPTAPLNTPYACLTDGSL